MNNNGFLFASECVRRGHPDKLADSISDGVLDALLEQDPLSRVACETMITGHLAVVAGEVTSAGKVDPAVVVHSVLSDAGYTEASYGMDPETLPVASKLVAQSRDIAQGVDAGGAGDQGLMFGYATNQTTAYMPLPIYLCQRLCRAIDQADIHGIWPDGKVQIIVAYDDDNHPVSVESLLVSVQHHPDLTKHVPDLLQPVIDQVFQDYFQPKRVLINPTGKFVIGGPAGDCGLTGRKIIVDTYGGWARHGGGAFSGKDPTKVDRSAAYMARWLALNVVAAGLAGECEVQLSYAIGVERPLSVFVKTDAGREMDSILSRVLPEMVDLSPTGIIKCLDLRKPIYYDTSVYGHFGHPGFYSWERPTLAEALLAEASAA